MTLALVLTGISIASISVSWNPDPRGSAQHPEQLRLLISGWNTNDSRHVATPAIPLLRHLPLCLLHPCFAVSPLAPPLRLLMSAESQNSPLISTMHSAAGVGGPPPPPFWHLKHLPPEGASWPRTLGAQREMSPGAEPPAAPTESGKLLPPRRDGKVRG